MHADLLSASVNSASVRQRRVLIVSPHFPPINAPDHQRVRTALPYLAQFGWQAHVLAVQPDRVEHPLDRHLEQTLPADLAVTRTNALSPSWTRQFGLGNLGLRCFPFFAQAGDRLLATRTFDLVFFSTTIFPVMALGSRWRKRFGVPYVLDLQDPWRSDYYRSARTHHPPGGRFKYATTQLLADRLEPIAMKSVSQIISVSPAYPMTLQQRYPWLRADQMTVLPFGASEQDFEQLPCLGVHQTIFDRQDGNRHWVYVGRGGADMALAVRSLFLAIRTCRDRDPYRWQSIRLHFVGTSYAMGTQAGKSIESIAQEYGLADQVTEHPLRIPYFEAQQLLVESDAILLIGSDDPSYTASKLYPSILARKPILAIFHQHSSVIDILQQCQAGQVVAFASGDRPEDLQGRLIDRLQQLLSLPQPYQPTTDWSAFQPYTAYAMTRQLCQVFDRCLTSIPQTADGTP